MNEFDLVDLHWSSATVPATIPTFTKDSDNIFDDQRKNWKSVPDKSFKTECTVAVASDTATTYWCKELNSHFVRNWITDSAFGHDINLTDASKDLTYDVFGWISSSPYANYSGAPYASKIGKIV